MEKYTAINLVILLSGTICSICFYSAYINHKRHKKGRRRYLSGLVIGGLFAVALTVFVDALLYRLDQRSFFQLMKDSSLVPIAIFIAGALQGIVYEYIGSFSLDLWYYPTVRHKHKLFLLLPFFWALFMVIMQDVYTIFRSIGLSSSISFVLTALIPFALIEGINVYAKSWIYKGVLKPPVFLAIGWFILAYTFVLGFNAYALSPFNF